MKSYPIVFSCDEKMLIPLGTVLFSLWDSKFTFTKYKVYVLSYQFSDKSKERLQEIAGQFNEIINFIDIDDFFKDKDLLTTNDWPIPAWSRIFIPELIPDETGYVLYIDTDTLICNDLSYIFEIDLKEKALGAVIEGTFGDKVHKTIKDQSSIENSHHPYFNLGVLLINQKIFKEKKLSDEISKFAQENKSNLIYPYQDSINIVLMNNIKPIHPRWNLFYKELCFIKRESVNNSQYKGYPLLDSINASLFPYIIHYIGARKPWVYDYETECSRYESVMRKSGILKGNLPGKTILKTIKRQLYSIGYYFIKSKVMKMHDYLVGKKFDDFESNSNN